MNNRILLSFMNVLLGVLIGCAGFTLSDSYYYFVAVPLATIFFSLINLKDFRK